MGRGKGKGQPIHGILLLDKRTGISSNRALQEVKRLYNANKAGHTGSLDPLATGLLPICFGEATKVSAYLLASTKKYRAEITLGMITDSGDIDGNIIAHRVVSPSLQQQTITTCLQGFVGASEQVPPMYSALKHKGKRLYELARAGEIVERKPRAITIDEIALQSFNDEQLVIDVVCSKGTYIRTLAEDIGAQLGCGATISALRRLAVGQFDIAGAKIVDQLQGLDDETLQALLLPIDTILKSWPSVMLDSNQAQAIVHGQSVADIDVVNPGQVRIYSEHLFLGIGELQATGILAPKRVFNWTHN